MSLPSIWMERIRRGIADFGDAHLRILMEEKRLRIAALSFVGILCLCILLYAFVNAPASLRLKRLEERYTEIRKRHAEAIVFQRQKESFAGLKDGIPAQKDMPLLVKDLMQTARRLNLSVSSVNYDIPKRDGSGLTMLSFTFPAEGAYPGVKRFIYEVETSDRLIGIQDLDLDADRGRVKLQMKIVAYIKGR